MARILLTASSRHGSTAQIAEHLAARLTAAGHDATVRPPADVTDLAGFDAVVVGSAVYMGSWTKEAVRLVDRIAPQVGDRPVWAFSSGPLGDPPVPAEVPPNAQQQADRLGAREHRVFAGSIDQAKLSGGQRLVVRMVKMTETRDDRPWPQIDTWADQIAAALPGGPSAAS